MRRNPVRRQRRRPAVAAVLLVGVTMTTGSTPAGAQPTRAAADPPQALAVPAYWAPDSASGAALFDRLVAAAPTVDTVIVNGPASGPAEPFSRPLAGAIRRLHKAGVTVLGYVDTGYLGRGGAVTTRVNRGSTAIADWRAQAIADARTWQRLYGGYGLTGVFFDQTLPTCGEGDEYVDAYGALGGAVWGRDPDAVVAINPGTGVDECYTEVADVIVIAEQTLAAYRHWTPPAWVADHPATTFWHLVHGAATAAEMREALALARERRAGYVYVTDAVIDPVGGPWNTLPAADYWSAELADVAATRRHCRVRVHNR